MSTIDQINAKAQLTTYRAVPATDGPVVRAADRWLITGAVLAGSLIFSLIGLVVIAIGFLKTARAKASGEFVRPAAVTLFAMFAMVDAAANFLGWSLDLWAHDTRIVQWGLTGWGRLADAAYYLDYNSLWAGGSAAAGEKSWEVFCILGVFPARMVAAYGFIKLKRWGYRWMIITSWAYVMLWLGYRQHGGELSGALRGECLRRHRLVGVRHLVHDTVFDIALALCARQAALEPVLSLDHDQQAPGAVEHQPLQPRTPTTAQGTLGKVLTHSHTFGLLSWRCNKDARVQAQLVAG